MQAELSPLNQLVTAILVISILLWTLAIAWGIGSIVKLILDEISIRRSRGKKLKKRKGK